jgi:D-specific alpha-keto acid dehydrogenase
MTYSETARTVARRGRSLAPSSPAEIPALGITVYGCDGDEARLFQEIAPRFGVLPTITEAALSEASIGLALGNRCISVGHKSRITDSILLALSRAGVTYLSTRSVGCNHIDVKYAETVGISVENVAYSPDSVADYTVMLMLMAVRKAKALFKRTDAHDYRLDGLRGRELRDLTVGVVGTGRIGMAVVNRLRGFGCRVLAYDTHPTAAVDYVSLDALLRESDVITIHIPLAADTHHLLDRARIGQLKDGAVVINTARGSVLDTDALLEALEDGPLSAAGLDVLEGEEGIFYADYRNRLVANETLSRLHRLPNVLISPHIAYYTDHALADMVRNSIANCLRFATREQHG